MSELKLISLNIEGEAHIDLQRLFLNRSNAELICLQEIFESTFNDLKRSLGMYGVFAPMWKRPIKKNGQLHYDIMGVATFSKYNIEEHFAHYYHGDSKKIVEFIPETTPQDLVNRVLLVTQLRIRENENLTLVNTHFTWSRGGKTSKQQESNLKTMLSALDNYDSLILCGDFNAPRGGSIFEAISKIYTDHIPAKYTSSIDGKFHYAGYLDVMVDGLFSTKDQYIHDVRLTDGVSDHCAIEAIVRLGV